MSYLRGSQPKKSKHYQKKERCCPVKRKPHGNAIPSKVLVSKVKEVLCKMGVLLRTPFNANCGTTRALKMT